MTRSATAPMSRSEIDDVVHAATLAPSILNCQPWRFHAHHDVIDVYAVPEQAPAVIDPTGREVHLSLGAAVLNLRLAVGAAGRVPVVQLMPSTMDPQLVATVRFGGPGQLSAAERELYDAIPHRRSSRVPFVDEVLPIEHLAHLQEAAALEGAHLEPATGLHRSSVLDALHHADRQQRSDPGIRDEVAVWTVARRDPDVGVPFESLGPLPHDPSAAVRDVTAGAHLPGRPAVEFEKSALLAVLLTTGDHPVDWLRAGLALERVALTVTVRGLSIGLLSQATEVAEVRPLLRDTSIGWRHPQMVVRLGHGAPMPPTPRRPVSHVLTVDGDD